MTKHECAELMDLLVDYLEGDLTEPQEERLEFHLELCPPCVNFVESYKKTGKICREALEHQMPNALRTNLHSFLKKSCCGDEVSEGSEG